MRQMRSLIGNSGLQFWNNTSGNAFKRKCIFAFRSIKKRVSKLPPHAIHENRLLPAEGPLFLLRMILFFPLEDILMELVPMIDNIVE